MTEQLEPTATRRKPPQGCAWSPRKPKPRVTEETPDDYTAVVQMWRRRCWALEEQLGDATRALRAAEEERRELSLDYKHALDKLWRQRAQRVPAALAPVAKDTTNATS